MLSFYINSSSYFHRNILSQNMLIGDIFNKSYLKNFIDSEKNLRIKNF